MTAASSRFVRCDAAGRVIEDAAGVVQPGQAVSVGMMFTDAAGRSAAGHAVSLPYVGAGSRSGASPVGGSSPTPSTAILGPSASAAQIAYADRCRRLGDAWRGEGNTMGSVTLPVGVTPASLRDAAHAIRVANLSNAWRGEDK